MNGKIVIEKISQPECRLPVINIFSQYLSEISLLAAISFAALSRDSALFLVNADTLKEEKHFLPEGASCGMYSFVKGKENNLYFASHSDSSLYCFDIEKKSFQKLSVLSEKPSCFVGMYVSSSGKIYVGTYPEGSFYQYDPVTGNKKRFSTLPHENLGLYCSDFVDLPDGKMLILTSGGNPGLTLFNPATEECQIVYRGEPEKEIRGFFNGFMDDERILVNYYNSVRIFNWKKFVFEGYLIEDFPEALSLVEKVDDYYYFSGSPSGNMYRMGRDGITIAKDDFPNFNMVRNYYYLGNSEFICVGDNGLVMRFNLKTGKMVSHQIDNVSDSGMGMQFLDKIPEEDFVIGAHFINSQMFRINLSDKNCESSINKVVAYPGQVNCGTAFNGKYYIGSYVKAVISEYDYRKPFIQGENPLFIGEIGQGQYRPIDMVNDGNLIYIATGAQYGKLGGAITVFNPANRQMDIYRHFIQDQNPTCLFYWPEKRLLVGATTIHGDCRTAKPTASQAVLFLWDTVQRKTVYTCSPWEMSSLKIIDVSPAGVCLGTKNPEGSESKEYFLWDIKSQNYEIKEFPIKGVFINGIFMNEREFYGATEHGLFILDIKTGNYEMLSKTSKNTGSYCARCFEKLNDYEFLFDIEGVNVMKATITN